MILTGPLERTLWIIDGALKYKYIVSLVPSCSNIMDQ